MPAIVFVAVPSRKWSGYALIVLMAYSLFNVARSAVPLVANGGWSLPTG